jgi:hypothetical protein
VARIGVGVGDLLAEDAAAGSGEAVSAALAVAAAFDRGCVRDGEAAGEPLESVAAHPGQLG